MQGELDPAPFLGARVQVGLVEADVVAAAFLGPVEREVGIADQLLDAVAVDRADRGADAGADEQPLVAIEEGPLQRADQRQAELLELVAALDLGHHDRELVAAEPAGGHLVRDHRLEAARDLLQQMVAGDVAEAVIDRFEAVEIDQQDRALRAAAARGVERGAEIVEQLEPVGKAGERVVPRHMGDPVGRLAGAGDVRADPVIAAEPALLVVDRPGRELDALDRAVDREAHHQLREGLAPRHDRFGAGERPARGLVGARQLLEQLGEAHALELFHRTADRPREAGRDVLEAQLGVGLPQPVGVRAFIFAQQQADRLLALLERQVEPFALHEGTAVDQHHDQEGAGIDRPDRGDHPGIAGHQHARAADAHDDDVARGRCRDRREHEGGARHHRRGDHAHGELLAMGGVLEEIAGGEAPDHADEDRMVGRPVDRRAGQGVDLAAAQLALLLGEIEHQHRDAEQPQGQGRRRRLALQHVADQQGVEGLAPGGDGHRRAHLLELRRAHAAPPPAARGNGAVEDDAPVELGQALVGHGTPERGHKVEALGKR